MDCLKESADGVVLVVRAAPGARRNQIRGLAGAALKVSVTAPPEKGKANKALHEFLCHVLTLRSAQLQLINGLTSARKRFLVRDVTREELEERLRRIL